MATWRTCSIRRVIGAGGLAGRLGRGVLAIGALLAGAPAAVAGSASANLNVSAAVVTNCTITTSPVNFGNYDPVVANASADLLGTGTVTVACTKGTQATIGLSTGQNSGQASGTTRAMAGPNGNYLSYELYQDSGRATVWTDSGSGLLTTPPAPNKNARDFTVYGRVPAGQDVEAGNYSDTVTATVNF